MNEHIEIKMNLIQTTLQSYGIDITKTKHELLYAKFINKYYFGLPKVSLVIEAWKVLVNEILPGQDYVNLIHHKGVIEEYETTKLPSMPIKSAPIPTKKHK